MKLDPAQLDQLELQLAARLSPKKRLGPEFNAFAERFLSWSIAERQKPSTLAAKRMVLRLYLRPLFGGRLLGSLTAADVAAVKEATKLLKGKTVNNVLTVLRRMLRLAVQLGELDELPVQVPSAKVSRSRAAFYDFAEYERLVLAARKLGAVHLVVVLLGGDAGLRMGEMLGLDWLDVELSRRQLHVQRSDWYGVLSTPKNGHSRVVPLTELLHEALEALPTRAGRVLGGFSVQRLRRHMRQAQDGAELEPTGRLHVLRHTFCSHLAMRGAAMPAVRELAGHRDDSTTGQYVHLARNEAGRAIGLLDAARATKLGPTRETL